MRSHTSRDPSHPTPRSRHADVEPGGIQDVYLADGAWSDKMTWLSSWLSVFIPGRRHVAKSSSFPNLVLLGLLVACTWFRTASAIGVPFDNCLPDNYIYTHQPADQVQLQWIPVFVDAEFDTQNPTHNLRVTVWGNVTGRVGSDPLPSYDSKNWSDPNSVLNGKIQNVPEPNAPADQRKVTTLHTKVDVLTYEPYVSNVNFCESISDGTCPLGPVFANITSYVVPAEEKSQDKDGRAAHTNM